MKLKTTQTFTIIMCALLLAAAGNTCCAESNFDFFFKNSTEYKDIKVKEILSASKIRLENDEIISLIGLKPIDPPKRIKQARDKYGVIVEEKVSPFDTIEQTSYTFIKYKLENKSVRLEFDIEKKDSDFVTQAYVFINGSDIFINAEILKKGFTNLRIIPPNTKYEDKLRSAYLDARKEKRGIHSEY